MRYAHHLAAWWNWYRKQDKPVTVEQILADAKSAGYGGVETPGNPEVWGAAKQFRRRLEDADLRLATITIAVTANPHPPNTEEYRRALDWAAELGLNTIAVCGGFLGRNFRATFNSDYELFASNLRQAQEYADQYGQVLAYHPHCACMVETAEELERLLAYFPELCICVDTGHLIAVGSDPVALIRRYPEKIKHVHLKDWSPEEGQFTEIGQGTAGQDFPGIFQALDDASYDGWIVVERDNPAMPPAESARISLENLLRMEGVKA